MKTNTKENEAVGHTPGPWYEMTKGENQYQAEVSQEGTGRTIALTYTGNDADVRLIAAAPELLAALTDLVRLRDATFAATDKAWAIGIVNARAAIAKATATN